MRTVLAAAAGIAIAMAASAVSAQTVYPIDRADILSGARFDFKVEFAGLADPSKISITLNGKVYEKDLGPKSVELGAAMTTFDPGHGWKALQD